MYYSIVGIPVVIHITARRVAKPWLLWCGYKNSYMLMNVVAEYFLVITEIVTCIVTHRVVWCDAASGQRYKTSYSRVLVCWDGSSHDAASQQVTAEVPYTLSLFQPKRRAWNKQCLLIQ
jgi:hypothetical protein